MLWTWETAQKGKVSKSGWGRVQKVFLTLSGPGSKGLPRAFCHKPNPLLHRCNPISRQCKRPLARGGPKDLLHPLLTTFGKFRFSGIFQVHGIPSLGRRQIEIAACFFFYEKSQRFGTPSSRLLQCVCFNLWALCTIPLVALYCAMLRDYLSDTPLLGAMGLLVSQHGQLGAIPPPPFLSVSPLESMRSGGAIPPSKRVISATLARYL